MIALFAEAFVANACLFVPVWLLATALKKVSLVDVIWGPSFAITLTVGVLNAPTLTTAQLLLASLIYAWALRLALHLLPRALHDGEDKRYTAMREGRSPAFFVLWSLVSIFGLQILISLSLSTPFMFALEGDEPLSILLYLGASIAALGLVYETVADYQLRSFLSKPKTSRTVCQIGLWKLSRHPNYFGECLFWWGIWVGCVALSAPLWTMYAPIGLTILLLRVSGITMMESTIGDRRPGYTDYVRTTNAFIPGPRRKSV